MKSAPFLVLFPLFALGVFGDERSVNEGESDTLRTGFEIKGSDEIEWRFNGDLIFRVSSSAGKISVLDDTKGKFGNRLRVEEKSGDLTITNSKITDTGEYKLQITSTKGSSDKTFMVKVVQPPGLSSGAIAGIVIGVFAAVIGAVAGIYYGYRKKGEML